MLPLAPTPRPAGPATDSAAAETGSDPSRVCKGRLCPPSIPPPGAAARPLRQYRPKSVNVGIPNAAKCLARNDCRQTRRRDRSAQSIPPRWPVEPVVGGQYSHTTSGARLCLAKRDQPQPFRKTTICRRTTASWRDFFHVLRLVCCTQPRSDPVTFGGNAQMRSLLETGGCLARQTGSVCSLTMSTLISGAETFTLNLL